MNLQCNFTFNQIVYRSGYFEIPYRVVGVKFTEGKVFYTLFSTTFAELTEWLDEFNLQDTPSQLGKDRVKSSTSYILESKYEFNEKVYFKGCPSKFYRVGSVRFTENNGVFYSLIDCTSGHMEYNILESSLSNDFGMRKHINIPSPR